MGDPDYITLQAKRQLLAAFMGKESRAKEAAMDMLSGPKDSRGRVLQEGDEILLNVKGPIFYRIAAIQPNVDPQLPQDLLFVHVVATVAFSCKRGALNNEFIRVQTQEEAGPLPFELIEARPGPQAVPLADPADRISER